jgi:hypothetical protein
MCLCFTWTTLICTSVIYISPLYIYRALPPLSPTSFLTQWTNWFIILCSNHTRPWRSLLPKLRSDIIHNVDRPTDKDTLYQQHCIDLTSKQTRRLTHTSRIPLHVVQETLNYKNHSSVGYNAIFQLPQHYETSVNIRLWEFSAFSPTQHRPQWARSNACNVLSRLNAGTVGSNLTQDTDLF